MPPERSEVLGSWDPGHLGDRDIEVLGRLDRRPDVLNGLQGSICLISTTTSSGGDDMTS